jgi:cytochrome c-type biogenesis protein CcmH
MSMRFRVSAFAFALLLLGGLGVVAGPSGRAAAQADTATQYQIETDLTCQCGCGLTVHSCNHLNCGSGIPLKQEIAEQIKTGKTRTEILSYFEGKYGEKILSAPTTRGFNIAAWTVPFIAIAIGGLLVALVISRWRHATVERARPAAPGVGSLDPALRERLERELNDFDRRS